MSKHTPDTDEAAARHAADVAFIEALAQILDRNALTELAVKRAWGEDDSLEVRVARTASPVQAAPVLQGMPVAPGAAPLAGPPSAPAAALPDDPAQHPGAVTSPMVGTAYLAPEPGAAAFVSGGQIVTEGQTLLIIEAMKTMNQIPSPRAGTVRRILIEDGTPVEYGAPLMIVE